MKFFTREQIKFTASSVFSAITELVIFYFLKKSLSILSSTIISRIISTALNFIINKLWSFKSQRAPFIEILKFTVLFLVKMFSSAGIVQLLSYTRIPTMISKIIVDSFLFFASYLTQKYWIFKPHEQSEAISEISGSK